MDGEVDLCLDIKNQIEKEFLTFKKIKVLIISNFLLLI